MCLEEVRNGYIITAQRKSLWKVQLQLLNKFLEVCERYGITVWAGGGTLLGAVREKGFIPWDDDIDICMLRSSFDKLVEIGPKVFNPPYFFQCTYTEKDFPGAFAKLRMDDTAFILKSEIFQDYHQGICIDLFPLDAFPDDPAEYQRFKKRALAIRENLYMSCYFKGTSKLSPVLWYKYLKGKLFVFLNGGLYKYHRKYVDVFRQYSTEENEYVGNLTLDFDEKHFHFKRSIFNETLVVPFEDTMIPIPKGYDEFLRIQYGEYMIPVQAPSLHGNEITIDVHKSYKIYLPELRKRKRCERWGKIRSIFHLR